MTAALNAIDRCQGNELDALRLCVSLEILGRQKGTGRIHVGAVELLRVIRVVVCALFLFAGRGRLFNRRQNALEQSAGCVLEAIGRDDNVAVIGRQCKTTRLEFAVLEKCEESEKGMMVNI